MVSAPRSKDYFKSLPNDITASIVVFLVALPLCLGVALASNAPLFSGVIAGIVGGIVIGLASKSHLSVSGPAAGLTAIVATAVTTLPSFQAFLVAVVIGGVLQIVLGFVKAGVIGDYVPNSVIKGMLAAIGIILILKQFPHLVGYDKNYEGDESFQQGNQENTFSGIIHAFKAITPLALFIGVGCLLFHFAWEKLVAKKKGLLKLIPAPLLIVLAGAGVNYYFSRTNPSYAINPEHLVSIPAASSASEFFSFFTLPDWNYLLNKDVLVTGLILALVASLESLLSIEAVDGSIPACDAS
jgi:MFS superfamily sulfate permease-like transporter